VLAGNKVVKRFDGSRIQRVAWKVVRGLNFHHNKTVFPEALRTLVSLTPPGEEPPDHFKMFMGLSDNEPHGVYPGIFDYRFQNFTGEQNIHYWAFLLWDCIIITVLFHDPACECSDCHPPDSSETVTKADLG